jgi:hypothetical protein
MKANDHKALEQAEKALKDAGFVIPATVYEPLLDEDQMVALRECIDQERMCSGDDAAHTALPTRLGDALVDLGLVYKVRVGLVATVSWYVITSKGRDAFKANL